MSAKALKRAFKNAIRDEFEDGAVIRFEMHYPFQGGDTKFYTYCAVKTPVGWCTTAQPVEVDISWESDGRTYFGATRSNVIGELTTTSRYRPHVPPRLDWDGLLKILLADNVKNVAVADTWDPVS